MIGVTELAILHISQEHFGIVTGERGGAMAVVWLGWVAARACVLWPLEHAL